MLCCTLVSTCAAIAVLQFNVQLVQVLHNGELVSDGIVKALKVVPKEPDAWPELAITKEARIPTF